MMINYSNLKTLWLQAIINILLVNDTFGAVEDTPLTLNVLQNDSFNPNQSFSISSISFSNETLSTAKVDP